MPKSHLRGSMLMNLSGSEIEAKYASSLTIVIDCQPYCYVRPISCGRDDLSNHSLENDSSL